MVRNPVRVQRHDDGRVPAGLAEQVRSIYVASFPEQERAPFVSLMRDVEQGDRAIWLTEPLQGFALTVDLETSSGDVLLEYLAVASQDRNAGLGSALIGALLRDVSSPIVLEVEEPEAAADPFASRRVDFYARHGAVELPHSRGYCAPNLVTEGALPMQLWDLAPERRARCPGRDDVQHLVAQIWRKSYGLTPTDDRVAAVLRSLSS